MDAEALGRYLRETREARELSLEDAANALHIRRHILESFEQGIFSISGSRVQIRGFLRNYARYLELDENQIVDYYQLAMEDSSRGGLFRSRRRKQDGHTPDIPIAPRRITDTPPALPAVRLADRRAGRREMGRRLWTSLLMLILTLGALGVIAFVLLDALDIPLLPDPTVTPTARSVTIDLQAPTATFTPSITPRPQQNITPTPMSAAFPGAGVLLEIEVVQRTWLRIVVDETVEQEGIVEPGEFLRYETDGAIDVQVASASALDVTFNGEPWTLEGMRGQRVDLRYADTGIDVTMGPGMQPSATPSPTATITPVPSSTPVATVGPSPTPSETPVPSETPIPSNTPTLTATVTLTPTITSTPTITPTPSDTPTRTPTPTVTITPSPTVTPTITSTATPTAILPPRATREGATPVKGAES